MYSHDPRPLPDSEPTSTEDLAHRHMPEEPPLLPEPSDDRPDEAPRRRN